MQTSNQRPMPETSETSTKLSGLTWLGVFGGACILAIHSFSGQAIDDATLAPTPMTGANLSALHAAIADGNRDQEPLPTI